MSDNQNMNAAGIVKDVVFDKGLPGFRHLTRFILDQSNSDMPFAVLQSLENKDTWFLIGDPFVFYQDYEFELTQGEKDELGVDAADDIAVWGVITYKGSIHNATINLQAPVVINRVRGRGKQIILNDTRYSIRHPLVLKPSEKGGGNLAGA